MALILTALAVGQITYNNSLALAIGANIGTTITAILGALSANNAGKKLAGAHLIFNLVTGFVALIFINQLGLLVDTISEATNIAPDNYIIKLSIFHTIFNVLGVLIMLPFIKLLVKLLNRIFIEKENEDEKIEYPKYLNENILSYPQTAYKALLDESKRLFEKATFEILCHSLNLHTTDIKGDLKLKAVVKKSTETLDIDIDDMYYRKIKIIYSKIIKYATLAVGKFNLEPQNMERFARIKVANRKIVETIKDLHGLRTNINQYMDSENTFIQKEYNRLRKKVSGVLREIYLTQIDENPQTHLDRLEKLKNKATKSDVLLDGTLDTLIRENKISSVMATSLANDSDNVANISTRLIEIAELLYIESDTLIEYSEEKEEKNNQKNNQKKKKKGKN
jgi:phosphate:Na+ symporter